VIKTRNSEKGD